MINKTKTGRPEQENFINQMNATSQTPEINSKSIVGYISIAKHFSRPVGYRQSLRLSTAPLKPTPVSMMVKSAQFGAQKTTGSSYRMCNQ